MPFRNITFSSCLLLLFISSAVETHAQTPHTLLWNGTRNEADRALQQMKKDPSWVHKKDGDQRIPLHVAARFGHVKVVKWLLENGADVNAQAYNRFTPLHLTSDPEVVKLILAKNPDLSLQSVVGTPLQRALRDLKHAKGERRKQLDEIVKLYVDHDPEVDIVAAIRLDRINRVRKILEKNPKLAHRHQYTTPLREAAEYGTFEICKYLIEEHDVDVDDFEGGSGYPIIKSALKYPKIVKLLIDHGADLDTPITWKGGRTGVWIIGDEATALHFAACDGTPETVKLLIDGGVPFLVNTDDSFGGVRKNQTALDVAAIFGRTDNVEALLNNPNYVAKIRKSKGMFDRVLVKAVNPLSGFYARQQQDPVKMVELLIQAGANPEAIHEGQSLIQIAAARIHPNENEANQRIKKVVELLHQSGAEMDLFSAIALDKMVEIKRILKKNPSTANARRNDGYPALHLATAMNRLDIVALLLDHGVDINVRNLRGDNGETALDAAAFWENPDVAKLLVKRGANVGSVDKAGNTPLHSAAYLDQIAIARLLVENGASPNVKNHKGETPLDIAKSSVMKTLLKD